MVTRRSRGSSQMLKDKKTFLSLLLTLSCLQIPIINAKASISSEFVLDGIIIKNDTKRTTIRRGDMFRQHNPPKVNKQLKSDIFIYNYEHPVLAPSINRVLQKRPKAVKKMRKIGKNKKVKVKGKDKDKGNDGDEVGAATAETEIKNIAEVEIESLEDISHETETGKDDAEKLEGVHTERESLSHAPSPPPTQLQKRMTSIPSSFSTAPTSASITSVNLENIDNSDSPSILSLSPTLSPFLSSTLPSFSSVMPSIFITTTEKPSDISLSEIPSSFPKSSKPTHMEATEQHSSTPSLKNSIFPSNSPSTKKPSISPSATPTLSSPSPSLHFSVVPSKITSTSPTIHKTSNPTTDPVFDIIQQSSISPSLTPSREKASTSPSLVQFSEKTMEPTNMLSNELSAVLTLSKIISTHVLPLPPFAIFLTTESPISDNMILLNATSEHLTNIFLETMPDSMGFQSLSLSLSNSNKERLNNRRQLQVTYVFNFEGDSVFITSRDMTTVGEGLFDEYMNAAFSNEYLDDYQTLLERYGIDVTSSFVHLSNEEHIPFFNNTDNLEENTNNMNDAAINQSFAVRNSIYIVWGLATTTMVTFLVLLVATVQKHRSHVSYNSNLFMGSDTISSHDKISAGSLDSESSESSTTASSQNFGSGPGPGKYIHIGGKHRISSSNTTVSGLTHSTKYRFVDNPKKVSFEEEDIQYDDNIPKIDYVDYKRKAMQHRLNSSDNFMARQPYRNDPPITSVQGRGDFIHSPPRVPVNKPKMLSVWKSKIPSMRRNNNPQAWYREQVNEVEVVLHQSRNKNMQGAMFIG